MNAMAVVFLRWLAPALGVLLGVLGFYTAETNLVGWLLFVAGVAYAAGTIIVAHVLKRNFWEANATGLVTHMERGDRSFWLISAAMAAVFLLSPLEFIFLRGRQLPLQWLEIAGLGLGLLGAGLFVWARRVLGGSYSGKPEVREAQPLVRRGPYRLVRHPAYAAYLLMCAGLAVGYASLAGALGLALLMVPAVLWRIRLEEHLLSAQFGRAYGEYAQHTKRLIPGVW